MKYDLNPNDNLLSSKRIEGNNPNAVCIWVNSQRFIKVVSVISMNIGTGYFIVFYYWHPAKSTINFT